MAVSKIRQNYHEDCEALINKQINMEFYASYVYLSMVGFTSSSPSSKPLSVSVWKGRLRLMKLGVSQPPAAGFLLAAEHKHKHEHFILEERSQNIGSKFHLDCQLYLI